MFIFSPFSWLALEGIIWPVFMRLTGSSVLLNSFPTTLSSLVLSGPVPSLCQDGSLKASVFIFPSVQNTLPHTVVWLISSHHSDLNPDVTSLARPSLTPQPKVTHPTCNTMLHFIPSEHSPSQIILVIYYLHVACLFP